MTDFLSEAALMFVALSPLTFVISVTQLYQDPYRQTAVKTIPRTTACMRHGVKIWFGSRTHIM